MAASGALGHAQLDLLLLQATGEPASGQRARTVWNVSRVLVLLGINVLFWGHVVVSLWQIWFR